MKVLKFGGTSVGKPERMQSVARLIRREESKVVVLSALSGTTNTLVSIAEDLFERYKQAASDKLESLIEHYHTFIKSLYATEQGLEKGKKILESHFVFIKEIIDTDNFSGKEERVLLAEGELLSTQLFQVYLEEIGYESVLLPAFDFMKIDADGEPILEHIEKHLQALITKYPKCGTFITQGYICLNARGEVDNLKRGGSDYTASLIGAAIRADEIQIWTDIDGMHNNDPRIVKNTRPVAELSFDEAAELAYFGAKILHPATIHPAKLYNIPVRLLNTMQPEAAGTTILNKTQNSQHPIKSIAAKDNIIAIKIKSSRMLLAYGFLRKVFEVFEKYKTPIDMITTSEVAVSLTIDNPASIQQIIQEIEYFGVVEVDKNQTIICIVGEFVAENPAITSQVFQALQSIPLRMISFGGSEHNISILVNTSDKEKALNLLHEGLFLK
jgi:aspartate kinase